MATTWLRASMSMTPTSARGMATLKDIETRLKSVRNIKKITSSMKMVSAAKFTRAEKALKVWFLFSFIAVRLINLFYSTFFSRFCSALFTFD